MSERRRFVASIKARLWRSTLAMVLWRWRACDAERQRLKHRVRDLERELLLRRESNLSAIVRQRSQEASRLRAAAREACDAEFTSERLVAMNRLRAVLDAR